MSFASTPARLLVVAWLILVGAAVAIGVSGEQNDLGLEAEAALAEAGIDAAVEVSGRDVTLTGSANDQTEAEEVVLGIDGVRVVNWKVAGEEGLAAPESTTSTSALATTTAPPTTIASTLPPISEPSDGTASHVDARLENGSLTLRGTIPDAEIAARVAAVADLIYAPLLDNQLEVDPDAADASWVAGLPDAVSFLPIIGTSGLSIEGESAALFGYAPTEERLTQLQGAIGQALGPSVELTSQVEVTGLGPPSIAADVPGNGIVTVSGSVPSQEIVEFAIGLAMTSYGEENVVNELVIDPSLDTTFSLYRLPLVFPAFEPFPVWHVEIEDNVISGQLLSGATFPSGSAELTPELLQLMPVGAGILTRNPTLVMTVEGHTDDIGSTQTNQALSEQRAQAAKEWFIAAGIDEARVFAVGYGESRPIADNETAEGRAQNRRIEFRLGPPE